jgi:hypothetical protein
VKTLVAIVDASLQVVAFAGNLPAGIGLYVLISLAFWQTGNVGGCKRDEETVALTIRGRVDSISLVSAR